MRALYIILCGNKVWNWKQHKFKLNFRRHTLTTRFIQLIFQSRRQNISKFQAALRQNTRKYNVISNSVFTGRKINRPNAFYQPPASSIACLESQNHLVWKRCVRSSSTYQPAPWPDLLRLLVWLLPCPSQGEAETPFTAACLRQDSMNIFTKNVKENLKLDSSVMLNVPWKTDYATFEFSFCFYFCKNRFWGKKSRKEGVNKEKKGFVSVFRRDLSFGNTILLYLCSK